MVGKCRALPPPRLQCARTENVAENVTEDVAENVAEIARLLQGMSDRLNTGASEEELQSL